MFLLSTPVFAAQEKVCHGVEDPAKLLAGSSRFGHCSKGDRITVHTVALEKAFAEPTTMNHIMNFSMRVNEVHDHCSFKHPIIFIGETTGAVSALIGPTQNVTFRWYSCIYDGDSKEQVFFK